MLNLVFFIDAPSLKIINHYAGMKKIFEPGSHFCL